MMEKIKLFFENIKYQPPVTTEKQTAMIAATSIPTTSFQQDSYLYVTGALSGFIVVWFISQDSRIYHVEPKPKSDSDNTLKSDITSVAFSSQQNSDEHDFHFSLVFLLVELQIVLLLLIKLLYN
eukprot:c22002_g1_i1.p1 GENE.c22002_g1_i1~~c22002_g1_i1.p1  ORF type:complete len:124 (+),score=22.31 c22002_g1_i1:193-564(+)